MSMKRYAESIDDCLVGQGFILDVNWLEPNGRVETFAYTNYTRKLYNTTCHMSTMRLFPLNGSHCILLSEDTFPDNRLGLLARVVTLPRSTGGDPEAGGAPGDPGDRRHPKSRGPGSYNLGRYMQMYNLQGTCNYTRHVRKHATTPLVEC